MNKPIILSRANHHISRKNIDRFALKVLYHLHNNGFDAYLVGGCVRDLLLDKHPKDFDVVTNATPEEIKKLFNNCRLIGRRFRLAHIHFGRHIIEVATYRANPEIDDINAANRFVHRDNVFGTIEEDAWRRDFSINALYYNIADFSIVDYTGGLKDIKKKQLQLLGDPRIRYQEDPVRMLRAIRFAAKLGFNIETKTAKPIKSLADQLELVSSSRLFDELLKLFHCGHASQVYPLLKKHGLLEILLPSTFDALQKQTHLVDTLLKHAFSDTDNRLKAGKSVSAAYLYAFLLWPSLLQQQELVEKTEHSGDIQAFIEASYQVLSDQACITRIPKRFTRSIHEIWRLQYRLEKRQPRTIERILINPRFRAAFDLLLLRSRIEKHLAPIAKWWEKIQHLNGPARAKMIQRFVQDSQ